eukprot:gene4262-8483_t
MSSSIPPLQEQENNACSISSVLQENNLCSIPSLQENIACSIPSLRSTCINTISHNTSIIKKYYRKINILESSLVKEIITKSISTITPEDVMLLTSLCPGLDDDEELDIIYWKYITEKKFVIRQIPCPYKDIIKYVMNRKNNLEEWHALTEHDIYQELNLLSKVPFSAELFRITKIGVDINNLRKNTTGKNLSTCESLLNKWRKIQYDLKNGIESHDTNISKLSTNIKSWRELYNQCIDLEAKKFESCSLKAKRKSDELKDSRRTTKQIQIKTPTTSRSTSSSFFSNISSSTSNSSSVRSVYKKPSGAIPFSGNKKSRPTSTPLSSTHHMNVIRTANGGTMILPSTKKNNSYNK